MIKSHPSFKAPDKDSLIDLHFSKQPHEKAAYIAFGRARNALGLPLIVPAHRKHLIWILDANNIRYRLESPAIEVPSQDNFH